MEGLQEELNELASGWTVEQLREEGSQVDPDQLAADISGINTVLEDLRKQGNILSETIGAKKRELSEADASDEAAEAAETMQENLASVRANAEEYVRLRTACTLLRREIERYRKENQGPLLKRASELFASLTLGSFQGLESDFGEKDQPILIGVRNSGSKVDVGGMSDGTRDQLYLSLRLATLEKHLEESEPMPFIVDDILIRFDDKRAKATLKVLHDLSSRTQVIFFTHHLRLVQIAQQVCNNKSLEIHTLGEVKAC